MVNIDTVYQKVLAIANKEQRGYITPQEFNLFANQAQMEMFEQYFYDIKQFNRAAGNTQEFSDPLSILYEKIGGFNVIRPDAWMAANMPASGTFLQIPREIYKVGSVTVGKNAQEVELLNSKDFNAASRSPLTTPTPDRPIMEITWKGLRIQNGPDFNFLTAGSGNDLNISYIKRPEKVEWAYVVVNDKALYNDNISVDFELHQSEETELVYKILKFAGINLKASEVAQVASAMEDSQVQKEKI